MKPQTNGQRWWYGRIESLALSRLHALQLRRVRGAPLWDGQPPVPVEHVIEHLLSLSITIEDVQEPEGGVVLGCLRPSTREIVLNERHMDLFERVPGLMRYTLGHETGHADVYGDGVVDHEQPVLLADSPKPDPLRLNSARGECAALSDATLALLRTLNPEERAEVLRLYRQQTLRKVASGQDSPVVRRSVDHYAACLLMPASLVRSLVPPQGVRSRAQVWALADRFQVSTQAMTIRLEEIGLIHGVDERTGELLLEDPVQQEQIPLL